jgi:hypothetical protein
MPLRPFCLLAVAAALTFASPLPLRAVETAGVGRLFQLGEKNLPADVAAARAYYEALRAARPGDVRLDYAYGLVLLHQHRYADALPLIDKYAAAHPADRDAAVVRLWALTQARRYNDAVVQAAAIVGRLPQPAPAGGDAALETVRTVGRTLAYIEAMQPAALDPKLKTKYTNQLLARLDATSLRAFDEGRYEVADRIAAFYQVQRDSSTARASAANKRLRELDSTLQASDAKLGVRRQQVDFGDEQFRDAARSLSVIRNELQTLMQDRLRLGTQIIVVQAHLSNLASTSTTTFDRSLTDPTYVGPVTSSTRTTPRYEDALQMQSLAFNLAVLNRQAVEIDKRILMLNAEAGKAAEQGQQASQAIAEHEAAMRIEERQAAALEKRARQMKAAKAKPATGLSGEMKRLATHVPLPYEDETKRVLGWFQK